MAKELKRRDLSGIFIFDTFPGESHRRPTCIEDSQPETRRRLLLTKSTEWQRDCIMKLAETFKDLCNYLVTEHCVSDEQRTEFFKMIDRNVERAKLNWAPHEMVPQVDFFCEKVTLLADACGVTKHKEEEDSE